MSAISAAKSTPKTIPPSSTFGELLRRSKFASYDPSIRQAYAAPPSYVHRGNWGLKRPIANRSRRGAIVLRKFEEHAQYIEWNRAEHQVKVVRAVEEMGVTPTLVPQTSWFIGLGQAATATESGFDSDFCPGENSVFERVNDERYADEVRPRLDTGFKKDDVIWDTLTPTSSSSPSSSSSSSTPNPIVALSSLGNSGKGAYGAKARLSVNRKEGDDALLQPNIQSMTPVEFQRYIEKLRKLRPEFLKYMREQLQKDWDNNHRCLTNVDPKNIKDEDLVFTFGTEARMKYLHMGFLGRYTNEHMFREDFGEADTEVKVESETEAEVKTETEMVTEAEVKTEVEVKTEAEVEAEVEVKTEAEVKAEAEGEGQGEKEPKVDPQYAEDMANRPTPIRKQPHKLGGLMYATPTALESFLFVKPSSGLVLQGSPKASAYTANSDAAEWIAAFGGMTAHLQKRHAGTVYPLYSPADGGIVAPRVPDPSRPGKTTFDTTLSEQQMRVIALELEDTPRVVGEDVSNKPLLTTRLRTRVVVDSAVPQSFRDNPYLPGSREYIDAQSASSLAMASRRSGMAHMAQRLIQMKQGGTRIPTSSIKGALPGAGATSQSEQSVQGAKNKNRDGLLTTLSSLLTQNRFSASAYPQRTLGFGRSKASSVEVVVEDEKKE